MYLIAQHTGGGCPGPECSFIFQLIKVDSVSCECCKACSTSSLDRFGDKLKYCGFRLRWLDVHTTRAAAATTNLRHECAHGRVTRSPSWSRRTHMTWRRAVLAAGPGGGWMGFPLQGPSWNASEPQPNNGQPLWTLSPNGGAVVSATSAVSGSQPTWADVDCRCSLGRRSPSATDTPAPSLRWRRAPTGAMPCRRASTRGEGRRTASP